MDQTAVAQRLRALATNDKTRSKAAQLRDVLDHVEAALAAGARRADVLAELEAQGLSMSLSTFETTLKRLRAKRAQAQTDDHAVQSPVGQPRHLPPTVQVEPARTIAEPSHDPEDLNRIIASQPDLIALAKLAKRKKR